MLYVKKDKATGLWQIARGKRALPYRWNFYKTETGALAGMRALCRFGVNRAGVYVR